MKDIADDLNISVVTVSKVLRNEGEISKATRERVLKRARELNYQPNWVARSLVTRRTWLAGLVVPDLMHSFFAEVAKGVTRKLRASGYNLVIANSEEDPATESAEIEGLLARRVDGLVIASAQPSGDTAIFRRIAEHKVPFVLIDRAIKGVKASYVGSDDVEIGRMATEHLISHGCTRIAHIRGPENAPGTGRLEGYRRALEKHGLSRPAGFVIRGDFSDGTGYRAMNELLRRPDRPDGVVCYNDPVAAGALKAILEAGLRVPGDVAVTGAGNVHYSDLLRVSLTTVDQNSAGMGESAAELLLETLASKQPPAIRRVMMETRVIARDSTRRLPDPRANGSARS